MTSPDRTPWLRTFLASGGWLVPGMLIIGFVLLASFRSSSRIAEAHGTVDQQQLISSGLLSCSVGGCGQTFTPTASNIVAFDVNISPQTTASGAMFVLRQWPSGPILAGPFPVTLVFGVNHVDIPGAPIAITPGTKYEIQETTGFPIFGTSALTNPYPGGGQTQGLIPGFEDPQLDLYFATYFLPATATPTATVPATVTRTVTPTVTSTATATATPILVPTVRPNVAGAFAGGASGTERNLQRAGVTNDPRAPLQPVPPQAQVGGLAAAQGGGPPAAGVLRPPSTGDAGLVGD